MKKIVLILTALILGAGFSVAQAVSYEENGGLERNINGERDSVINEIIGNIQSAEYTGSIINGIYTMSANNITVYPAGVNAYEPIKSFDNSTISVYYILNKASIASGMKPAYSYKDESDPDKWPVTALYRNDFSVDKRAGYYSEGTGSSRMTVYYYDKQVADKAMAEVNAKRDEAVDKVISYINVASYKGISHDGVYSMYADNVIIYSTELDKYEPFKTYNNKLVSSYYVLNKASMENGLEPVYSVNGETNPDNWPIENVAGMIAVSKTANGFRREGKRGSSSTIDTVSYHSDAEQKKYDEKIAGEKRVTEKKKADLLEKFISNISSAVYEVYKEPNRKNYFLMTSHLVEVYSKEFNNILGPSFNTESAIKYVMNVASVAKGYEPVYSVNGETDPEKWNLARYRYVDETESANGYRLANPVQLSASELRPVSSFYGVVRLDEVAVAERRTKKANLGKVFLDSIGLTISESKVQNVRLYYKGGTIITTNPDEHKAFAFELEKKSKALKLGFKNDDLFIVHENDTGKLKSTSKIIIDSKIIDLSSFGTDVTVEDIYSVFANVSSAKKIVIQIWRKIAGSYELKEITIKK